MTYVIPKFENEYFWLSNFYESEVVFSYSEGNLHFATAEHAFQASKIKAMDPGDQKAILSYCDAVLDAPTPSKAKYLGRSVRIDVKKWDQIKIQCMEEILKSKFDACDDLKKRLVQTAPAMLVEGNTWGDEFWGRCNGRGYNMLGVLLMELRGFYKNSTTRVLTEQEIARYTVS